MPPAISSVLTSKKPLDAHELLTDIGAREEFIESHAASAVELLLDNVQPRKQPQFK